MIKENIRSVAIGGFDGMHIAHQELFRNLCKNGAIVVIETGYASMTPKKFRERYTNFPIYYYNLASIKHLSANEFVELLQKDFQNLNRIVVGFDFKFGFRASGNTSTLKKLFPHEVVVINEFKVNGEAIHSRLIREYLEDGNYEVVKKYLGKNYYFEGSVVSGQGLGKKRFVPTLNLNVSQFLIPHSGVYGSFCFIKEKKYLSITFIGHRDTTDGNFAVETHIIDSELDFKFDNVGIELVEKIRENKKFDNFGDLKNQIFEDIKKVKEKLI